MIRLSAFADEISPDLHEQLTVLSSERIHFLDLRSVWGTNVLDLTNGQIDEIKQTLHSYGIGVAALDSPIGKRPVDGAFAEQLQSLERAIEIAHALGTRFIRIFSFYPPTQATTLASPDPALYRNEVMQRLRALTARARSAGIILLHENEKDIYGDTISHCVDIHQSIVDAHLRAVLDPANFLQCAQEPYPAAYIALRPWLHYVHVKDVTPDGTLVAAGDGAANWPALLQQLQSDGYDGFLSLEPHLVAAGQYYGFSGPTLFRKASQTFQGLLQAMQWEYN